MLAPAVVTLSGAASDRYFDVDPDSKDKSDHAKIFSVLDFTGDVCKTLGSRIRAAVAAEKFDNFHKHSARIIRGSIFGVKQSGKIGDRFDFGSNGLVITNVDVQAVEPVDARTRESLQRSVQLAIEITTRSQEARAKHEALRDEEKAKGKLEQQQACIGLLLFLCSSCWAMYGS